MARILILGTKNASWNLCFPRSSWDAPRIVKFPVKQEIMARQAGKEPPRETFGQLLEAWLSARFGGADGYLPTLSLIEHYRHHAHGHLDPLAEEE